MSLEKALSKTPLYDLHLELGGKMVPFAGYDMPVQYRSMGIIKEHLHTRRHVGLFDVSHMGQVLVTGENAVRELERLVPVDIESLAVGKQAYAVFTNERGGILDDLIIARWAQDRFFLVVNAACKADDIAHLRNHLASSLVEPLPAQALLALQGPEAKNIMASLQPAACDLTFMTGAALPIEGIECYVTRSGYTGEDGFEISLPAEHADKIARCILSFDAVAAIGLGARDSLRLEAGLCLYGHDMDSATSPVEAALGWSISKSRRAGGDKEGGFIGADTILEQITKGVRRKRVGLSVTGRIPVREGAELVNQAGETVGKVTSGGFAPSLNVPIAMAYVAVEYADTGTPLKALVRNKDVPVRVVKIPFVAQRYVRG